ncbi:unnamed protein product [Meganyctiphanes norvegica]|uniref:C2H2-type domain-containing protein n=1 Tax=Meganyctiphanes norvegica TaxID=48144 RepID=A0AAV2STJ1_MEGNR
MPDEQDKEKGPPEIIIDELLCFILNKFGNVDPETLILLCSKTFDEKEIEASKDILFNLLCDESCTTKFVRRRAGKVNETAKANNMRDMFQLLQEKGDAELPRFVACDLGKLPPIHFDHIDVTVLLNKIENVSMTLKLLEDGMNKMCDVNKSIHEKNLSLEDRIANIEANGIISENNSAKVNVEQNNLQVDTNIDDCEKVIDTKIEEMPLACTECDIRFKTQSELNDHNVTTHDKEKERKFPCLECGKMFSVSDDLFAHGLIHKPYACTICEFRSASKIECQVHMTTHTGENSYSCPECNYKCKDTLQLDMHKNTHRVPENKHNICCVCDERCATLEELTAHMTIHKQKKPYSCSECDYECVDPVSLHIHRKKHMPNHTGGKLYACNECEFKSKNYASLNQHMNAHMKEMPESHTGKRPYTEEKLYACTECYFKSRNYAILSEHMNVHTGEKQEAQSYFQFPTLKRNGKYIEERNHCQMQVWVVPGTLMIWLSNILLIVF